LERVYKHLLQNGDSRDLPSSDNYGFARMCELMGFPEVWDFDRKWAERQKAAQLTGAVY
jgi:hypothetical protein